MGVFRKLTQFLTPPPERPSPMTPPVSPSPDNFRSLESGLKTPLRRLLMVPDAASDEAGRARATIHQMAKDAGPYRVAHTLVSLLHSMPPHTGEGDFLHKSRGFLLASDFILAHVRQELQHAELDQQPLGRNIFGGYCNELIDGYFATDDARRGIEVIIELVDTLLSKANTYEGQRQTFVGLAHQAMLALVDLSRQKLDRQTRQPRPPIAETEPPHAHEPDEERRAYLDESLYNYTVSLQQQVTKLSGTIGQVLRAPVIPPRDLSQEADKRKLLEHVEYLHEMLRAANQSGYLSFLASIQEQTAVVRERLQSGQGQPFFKEAAKNYETCARQESHHALHQLSVRHRKRAILLYIHAGMKNEAEALGQDL